jgi:hypothetical protein
LAVRHVECKKYDPNKHKDAPFMTEVDRGDNCVTLRCLKCKDEITIEGRVDLIHCAWIDSSRITGKKKIAVVCGNRDDWNYWQPEKGVGVKRDNNRMILDCLETTYYGITRARQAWGTEFDSMMIVGKPSSILIDVVQSRLR